MDPRNKIPSKIQLPSDEEIIQFLKIYKGISPYDPSNEWYKKMFNWDLYTHQQEYRYYEEMKTYSKKVRSTINKVNNENWKAWME